MSIAVLYFAPEPKGQPQVIAKQLLQSKFKLFALSADRKGLKDRTAVYVDWANLKDAHFEPPTMDQLRYFGRGVSSEQAAGMQHSTKGLVLAFSYGNHEAFKAIEQMSQLLSELAQSTNGLIWDEDTRLLFGVEAWNKTRLYPWTDGIPLVTKFTTIHAYKNGDYVRAVSLGMSKFGLPDIVVNDFSWSLNTQMGDTINAFSQLLIEGAVVPSRGPYDLRIQSLKHEGMRTELTKSFIDKATGVGHLELKEAPHDEGDPDNRLIELAFDRYSGKSVQERHDQFIGTVFGHHDGVLMTKHNDEILEVSKKAQAKFESFRTRFTKGLEPGEHLMVKAPFKTKDKGNEWMWVEVVTWKGGDISGLLRNDPDYIPGLHAGATVQIKQAEIFDYIRYTADGKQEGNETGPLLEKSAK